MFNTFYNVGIFLLKYFTKLTIPGQESYIFESKLLKDLCKVIHEFSNLCVTAAVTTNDQKGPHTLQCDAHSQQLTIITSTSAAAEVFVCQNWSIHYLLLG